ncbi:DUF4189 domain-containing protein [Dyella thiooxydans]|uniref:DUF4189 domain-containing protein n=1 Tax=Dyella thiooxydans TaxID=445710 RepID=UPI000A033FF7|nr:DUF4189 domain-containing protein [Dyella thiooxydans]
MNIHRWVLMGVLLLIASNVHAEGGCPPGMIPASGTNINSCIPIPQGYYQNKKSNSAQTPPERWIDRWGAIATYEPNGSLGIAENMPSQESAEQLALEDCRSKHGSTCEVQLFYRNQCAAMIVSNGGYNVTPAKTIDAAERKGMDICKKAGDSNCHVYYSACSLPQRIQ